MGKTTIAAIDENGKPTIFTTMYYPDEYTNEVPPDIFESIDRVQFINGGWIVHDLLIVEQTGNFQFTITLPANTPCSVVSVMVDDGVATDYQVVDNEAVIDLPLEAGQYKVNFFTLFHGSAMINLNVE